MPRSSYAMDVGRRGHLNPPLWTLKFSESPACFPPRLVPPNDWHTVYLLCCGKRFLSTTQLSGCGFLHCWRCKQRRSFTSVYNQQTIADPPCPEKACPGRTSLPPHPLRGRIISRGCRKLWHPNTILSEPPSHRATTMKSRSWRHSYVWRNATLVWVLVIRARYRNSNSGRCTRERSHAGHHTGI